MNYEVILDCDPGIDDAIALMLALGNAELIDLKLISTAAGNQTLDKTTENALKLLALMERSEIPVARGLTKPLLRDLVTAGEVHGTTGLGGVDLPQPTTQPIALPSLMAMIHMLESTPRPLTIVGVGPLTNVAMVLLARPDLKRKIERIIFMGGACFGGNISPNAEANACSDPEAAQIVLDSGLPLVMCGLDVTHKAYITLEEIARFRQIGNKTSSIFVKLVEFYAHHTRRHFLHPERVEAYLHDVTTFGYLLAPELFVTRDFYVTMDLGQDQMSRGRTVVDYNQGWNKPANVRVCFEVERVRLLEMIYQALLRLP